jgi:hypothetical protein
MVYDTNTLDNASENLQARLSKVTAMPSLELNAFRGYWETTFEQTRLLTLFRTVNPLITVDHIWQAAAYSVEHLVHHLLVMVSSQKVSIHSGVVLWLLKG